MKRALFFLIVICGITNCFAETPDWSLIDTYIVEAYRDSDGNDETATPGGPIVVGANVARGVKYKVEVSGTFTRVKSNSMHADAIYREYNDTDEWSEDDIHGLKMNEILMDYRGHTPNGYDPYYFPLHVYSIEFFGNDYPIWFQIADPKCEDNEGSLTVKLYEDISDGSDTDPDNPNNNGGDDDSDDAGGEDSGTPGGGEENKSASEDPIYHSNGEFAMSSTDLVLKGRVLDIAIKRFYRSRSEYNSVFGFGWDMNYNLRVRDFRHASPKKLFLLNGKTGSTEYVKSGSEYICERKPGEHFEIVAGGYELVKQGGVRYVFDVDGKLTEIVDRHDNKIQFEYDPAGLLPIRNSSLSYKNSAIDDVVAKDYRLTKITNDFGRTVSFDYYGPGDSEGLLETITDDGNDPLDPADDRVWTYTYRAADNRLLTVSGPQEYVDVDGTLTSKNLTTTYSYDGIPGYGATGMLTKIKDPANQTYIDNTYDKDETSPTYRMVTSQQYGETGMDATFSYDPDNNFTTVTDRRGIVNKYTYDDDGNKTGGEITVQVPKLRSSDPIQWYMPSYTYYGSGDQDGAKGKLETVTLPRDNSFVLTYDSNGNVDTVTKLPVPTSPEDGTSLVTTLTYVDYAEEDLYGFVGSIEDPKGDITSLEYDFQQASPPSYVGNLMKITFPEVNTSTGKASPAVEFTYYNTVNDVKYGRVETVKAPDGLITKYEYYDDSDIYGPSLIEEDHYGRLKRVTLDPDVSDITTEYEYDSLGHVRIIRNNEGRETEYVYNALDKLVEVIAPILDGATESYITKMWYNENRNLSRTRAQMGDSSDNVWHETKFAYNILDKLEKVTDSLGNETDYDYDNNDNLKWIKDAQASTGSFPNDMEYVYDERDLLWTATDAKGNVTKYWYNENKNLTKIMDANGQITQYAYDGFDRLKTTTYPDNTTETFTYDYNGNVLTATNRNGDTTTLEYDALNRVVRSVSPSETLIYLYDIAGRLVLTASPSETPDIPTGFVAHWPMDDSDTNTTVDDVSANNIDGYTQQSTSNLSTTGAIDDALTFNGTSDFINCGNSSSFDFANAVSISAWVNTTTGFQNYIITKKSSFYLGIDPTHTGTHSDNGKPAFYLSGVSASWLYGSRNIADGQWHHVAATYDGSMLRLYIDGVEDNSIAATGTISTGTEDVNIGMRDGSTPYYFNGSIDEVMIYPSALSQDEIVEMYHDTTSYQYDDLGRISEVTDQNGESVGYDHDDLFRREKLYYPDDIGFGGSASSFVDYDYDAMNRLTDIKDEAGTAIVHYDYDSLSRRTLASFDYDRDGTYDFETIYDYQDKTGNDDLGNNIENVTNRKTDLTVMSSYAYTYDNAGNRLSMNSQTYSYDDTYQLENVDSGAITYTYDALGNRESVNDAGAVTDYSDNALNQYDLVDDTAYSYDNNGNLTSDGQAIYIYDSKNRLIGIHYPQVTTQVATGITSQSFDITNYLAGDLTYDTMYNWRVDEVDSGSSVTQGDVWSFTTETAAKAATHTVRPNKYIYGEDDSIVIYSSNPPAHESDNYNDGIFIWPGTSWDTYPTMAYTEDYTEEIHVDGGFEFVPSDLFPVYSTFPTGIWTTCFWDQSGYVDPDIESGGSASSTFEVSSSLTADADRAAGPGPSNGATDVGVDEDLWWVAADNAVSHNIYFEEVTNTTTQITYDYDNTGRRMAKTVGADTTVYVYDGAQVIAEYENGSLARKFIYGPGIDEPVAMIDVDISGETWYFYHYDGLGSVVALSNTSSVIVERYEYSPFGITTIYNAAKTQTFDESQFGNPYMFTGRRYDDETGLYYYRMRYYSPQLGRFLQPDPIGYADGMNIYAYVYNNPLNYIDPLGLEGNKGDPVTTILFGAVKSEVIDAAYKAIVPRIPILRKLLPKTRFTILPPPVQFVVTFIEVTENTTSETDVIIPICPGCGNRGNHHHTSPPCDNCGHIFDGVPEAFDGVLETQEYYWDMSELPMYNYGVPRYINWERLVFELDEILGQVDF